MQRVMRKERLTAKTTPWAAALLGAGDLECSRLPDVCDHDDHEMFEEPWQDEEEGDGDFAYVGFDCDEQVREPVAKKPKVDEALQTSGASSSGDNPFAVPMANVAADTVAPSVGGKRAHDGHMHSVTLPKRQCTQGASSAHVAHADVSAARPHGDTFAAAQDSLQQGPWQALQERKRKKLAGRRSACHRERVCTPCA